MTFASCCEFFLMLDGRQKLGFLLTVRNHFRKLETAEKGGGPDMIDKCTVCEVAET